MQIQGQAVRSAASLDAPTRLPPEIAFLSRHGIETSTLRRVFPLPLYYVLVSVAAWRGLAKLCLYPFRWNKTEHGLARTSRRGKLTGAAEAPAPLAPEVDRG